LKSEEKEKDRRLGGEFAMPIVRANVLAARLSLAHLSDRKLFGRRPKITKPKLIISES